MPFTTSRSRECGGMSVVGGWLLPWRYRCLVSTGTFRVQCCSRIGSIDVLYCIEGKFGLKTLTGLAFCFVSATLHHVYRFTAIQQQEVFMHTKKASAVNKYNEEGVNVIMNDAIIG
ncbi:hypothetical protein O0I10_006393 [Lichtheimia ornata]|uniref:Uncharacterized protein n=1 Tax=Lichtheimia ornata TaxID=688661 RepID=A0AAD7V2Y5_9FUNG|nr:uncharacterized protein O0I10_006393 [Lichtheimia ornata]KAJ8657865.1 hypothetical protein O0I10_006393 [Lichtheimia ornata]